VENSPLAFSAGNGNRLFVGSGWDSVELDATQGTLTLATTSGLSFSLGNGAGNVKMKFSGSTNAMNAAMNGMVFTPTSNYNGPASVKVITINSGLLGLGLFGSSSTSTIAITVQQLRNQAPIFTAPGAQTLAENAPLIFTGGSAISVADADANGGVEQLTLAATNGTLTLSRTTGLSFNSGDGSGDSSMIFTGTVANIDAALANLTFNTDRRFLRQRKRQRNDRRPGEHRQRRAADGQCDDSPHHHAGKSSSHHHGPAGADAC